MQNHNPIKIPVIPDKESSFHLVKMTRSGPEVICFGLNFEQALALTNSLPGNFLIKFTRMEHSYKPVNSVSPLRSELDGIRRYMGTMA